MEQPSTHESREDRLEKENQELRLRINQFEESGRLKDLRIGKLESQVQELKKTAMIDSLTGLYNRRYSEKELGKYIKAINSEHRRELPERRKRKVGFNAFGLLFCDIDNFKNINDAYGHQAGDKVLKVVARIIQSRIRDFDIAARWSGDEIMVVLLGAEAESAARKAEEICRSIEEESQKRLAHYPDLKVSLSIGVAAFRPGLSPKEIVRRADSAMYRAKKAGRNRVESYQEENQGENQE